MREQIHKYMTISYRIHKYKSISDEYINRRVQVNEYITIHDYKLTNT